jgi:hypothetical protein
MYGITYVRVADEFGNEYSMPDAKALPKGHKLLPDKPAATTDGNPLPVKERASLAANVGAGAGLTGKKLTEALKAAGLSTKGTADVKRQRLADHQATQATPAADPADNSPEED